MPLYNQEHIVFSYGKFQQTTSEFLDYKIQIILKSVVSDNKKRIYLLSVFHYERILSATGPN